MTEMLDYVNEREVARIVAELRAEQPKTKPDGGSRQHAPPTYVPAYTKGLKILDGEQLLSTEFQPAL